jgi:hypothetical protein
MSKQINTIADSLVASSVSLAAPERFPAFVIDAQPNRDWWTISVATLYHSFALHWLDFLPVEEVWMALGRRMDETFFDFIEATSFDVTVSEIIVDPDERAAYCERARVPPDAFRRLTCGSDLVLRYLFADRCNQYRADLRAGVIREQQGETNSLGPVIFAFKRFNKHLYGIKGDMRSIELPDEIPHILGVGDVFFDAMTSDHRRSLQKGFRVATFTVTNTPNLSYLFASCGK